MRILFVNTVAPQAISDVARGYKAALIKAGHIIYEYSMRARFDYHAKAIPPAVQTQDCTLVSLHASETILNEALYHRADLVIIISGLNVHPVSLWLLGKVGIPVVTILTESPYDDGPQKTWVGTAEEFDCTLDMTVFTNDRYSAMNTRTQGKQWLFLPPAFDPRWHHPAPPDPDTACDVIMVGSGWTDRQVFLEAVNWEGINLKLYGPWLTVTEKSPLHRFLTPVVVNNDLIAGIYNSAKICFNMHRRHPLALTYGPRVIEAAACGAFQLSDRRADMDPIFGDTIPIYNPKDPKGFEAMVRYWIDPANDRQRRDLAEQSRVRVQDQTFDNRVASLVAALPIHTGQHTAVA